MQVNGPLPRRGGEQTRVPGRKPLSTGWKTGTVPYNIITGENSPPQVGIEPSPCNFGDKFAWSGSERTGSV